MEVDSCAAVVMTHGSPCSCPSWDDLPPGVVERVASLLPPNEVACTLRLIHKALSALFRERRTVRLSQAVPRHAFLRRWGHPDGDALRTLTLKLRRKLLTLTATSGDLANLQIAREAAGCPLVRAVFDAAASGNWQDMCRWLADKGCEYGKETVVAAAAAGHLAIVRWLLQLLRPICCILLHESERAAWEAAAGAGQRALCEGLLADGIPPCREALHAAARYGHLDITEWLLGLPDSRELLVSTVYDRSELLRTAAYGFDLESLQRLFYHDPQRRLLIFLGGVNGGGGGGDLEGNDDGGGGGGGGPEGSGGAASALPVSCIGQAWGVALCSPTPDWRAKAAWLEVAAEDTGGAAAATAGPLELEMYDALVQHPDCLERLELLRQRGRLTAANLALAAARAAALPPLRYLRQHGIRVVEEDATALAAKTGDVAVLGELAALGCPLRWDVANVAARRGHLAVLQWLAAAEANGGGGGGGCGGGEGEGGEALRQVRRRRCGDGLMEHAAKSARVELVSWLREWGCPWNERAFAAAAEAGSVAFLEWLVAEGCPMGADGEAYLHAGRNGDFATLCCLRRLGCPWGPDSSTFSRALFDDTEQDCSLAVLRWLVSEGCPVDWRQARRLAAQRHDGEAAAVADWVRAQRQQCAGGGVGGIGGGGGGGGEEGYVPVYTPPRMRGAAAGGLHRGFCSSAAIAQSAGGGD
ncbi:hypothetical protein PLESTM_002008600 [Pleodorina starrii]|nr:hypothetical protein PLESTM_002008600 [Pleodorina starrii]